MVSGQNFGVLDDDDPSRTRCGRRPVSPIRSSSSRGRYAAKHDPFVFFDDVNGWDGAQLQRTARCIDHVVDYSQLDRERRLDRRWRCVARERGAEDHGIGRIRDLFIRTTICRSSRCRRMRRLDFTRRPVQTILGLRMLPCDSERTNVASMDELLTLPLTHPVAETAAATAVAEMK